MQYMYMLVSLCAQKNVLCCVHCCHDFILLFDIGIFHFKEIEQLESSMMGTIECSLLFSSSHIFFRFLFVRVYCARTQNIDQRLLDRSKRVEMRISGCCAYCEWCR